MDNEVTSTQLHAGSDPAPDRAAVTAMPSRSAGLISLVRNLIAFGQALLQTLQSSPAAGVLYDITRRFGTGDLALIVARITRGLMLASALDAKLVRGARQLDAPPVRKAAIHPAASSRPPPPTAGLVHTPEADDAALRAALPTAQEIAARLRGKPIGVVLEEICHDLGITCRDKLWHALNLAILRNRGRLGGLFNGIRQRLSAYVPPPAGLFPERPFAATPSSQPSIAPTGTGPP